MCEACLFTYIHTHVWKSTDNQNHSNRIVHKSLWIPGLVHMHGTSTQTIASLSGANKRPDEVRNASSVLVTNEGNYAFLYRMFNNFASIVLVHW